jgi:hypothetical protein
LQEKDVHQPCRGGKLRLRGAGQLRAPSAAACLAPWLGWLWRRLQCRLPPPSGTRLFVHRTGDGRAVRRSAASVAHRSDATLGGRTRRRTPWRWRSRSWMVLSSLRRRAGARTSSCAVGAAAIAGKPPVRRWLLSSVLRWSPPLVRLPAAEVVASAGETTSTTYCRASNSLALMASLSPPVGRRGRGPLRNGARAEVVATAGESSVQRWPLLSVLRWSPPLASRSELATTRP